MVDATSSPDVWNAKGVILKLVVTTGTKPVTRTDVRVVSLMLVDVACVCL
ncbi:hypothetical protein HanPI659440_Chr07g0263571 [Helianthus annuus]|nr:hypothetical protein HanPI659440_Chr07g0263571 [Helianthus annuus]